MVSGQATLGLSAALIAVVTLAKHAANACSASDPQASVRFNSESDRLYLEGTGCITPSEIYQMKLSVNPLIPIKAVTEAGLSSVNETGCVCLEPTPTYYKYKYYY